MFRRAALVSLLMTSVSASMAHAENSKPQPVPIVDTIAPARDVAYPGTIKLDVDATDTRQGIFKIHETIPVAQAGAMTLLFPKWLPGNHSPTGQLDKLDGLHITANGQPVPWVRDTVDVYAFHIDVPEGAKTLDLKFQFLSATAPDQGRIVMTPNMLSLQPNSASLYPAGYFVRDIPVQMTVTYPEGWTAYSALRADKRGATYTYEPTNYQVLVDSPMIAGRYAKQWPLTDRVNLDVLADAPADLAATPEQIDAHKRLVEQAVKLFGSQHYDHYDFLLTLSDDLGGIGLEHHRSSEDGSNPGYFTNWDSLAAQRNLLPHEFTHSWNGKFRRPATLWTPDYRMPKRDTGLWVYEGQTQFWGYVLQARSGLVSKQDTLDGYAAILATYTNTPGREWRPLIDTTNDPIISQRRPKGWTSWQRSEDYYNEGLMVWMEVDSILRQQSHGTKSLDDFAKAFFGIRNGDWGEVTYDFDDVVDTLNRIQPYDWRGLLTRRLTAVGAPAPVQGFLNNGYKLVYTATPSKYFKDLEESRHRLDLTYSLGFMLGRDGAVSTVLWDGPAFKAGLDNGAVVKAVNGKDFSNDALKAAVVAAQDSKDPIQLTVDDKGHYRTISIDYHDGPRYPHLEKIGTGETGLDRLLAPK